MSVVWFILTAAEIGPTSMIMLFAAAVPGSRRVSVAAVIIVSGARPLFSAVITVVSGGPPILIFSVDALVTVWAAAGVVSSSAG